jgi:hypothetical protein
MTEQGGGAAAWQPRCTDQRWHDSGGGARRVNLDARSSSGQPQQRALHLGATRGSSTSSSSRQEGAPTGYGGEDLVALVGGGGGGGGSPW